MKIKYRLIRINHPLYPHFKYVIQKRILWIWWEVDEFWEEGKAIKTLDLLTGKTHIRKSVYVGNQNGYNYYRELPLVKEP